MTREELERRTKVQQAFLDEKPCQMYNGRQWYDMNPVLDFDWNWDYTYYRIRPEPRIIYVIDRPNFGVIGNVAWESQDACRVANGGTAKVIKFIEALDE